MTQSGFLLGAVFLIFHDNGPLPPLATHPCHHVHGSPDIENDPSCGLIRLAQTKSPNRLHT